MPRFVNPVPQFLDDAGHPLVNGRLSFFESGTDTPKATYADINLTILNTDPVKLSGSARAPNIFFDGPARVKAVDQFGNGVQSWDKDPVGGENIGGNFEQWLPSVIYSLNDIVEGSDGNFYQSFVNSNENNDPTTSPAFWQQVEFINVWNTNVDYAVGDTVKASDNNFYKSLVTPNQSNDPISSPSEWGTPFTIAQASETVIGGAEIATQPEVDAGADDLAFVTSLKLDQSITGRTDTVITAADEISFADTSDSNTTKKDTVQGVLDLVPGANLASRNPAMMVSQRGASFVTPVTGDYMVDGYRWTETGTITGTATVSQESSGGVSGDAKWLKSLVTVVEAPAAGDAISFEHVMEANTLQDLNSSAGVVASSISFDVIAHIDGASVITFPAIMSVTLELPDGTRSITSDISIAAADTWERVSINLPADASGVVNNDNGPGARMYFVLTNGTSQVVTADTWAATPSGVVGTANNENWFDAVNNFIGVTELKFEASGKSTPFVDEGYAANLITCQRYYWQDTEENTNAFGIANGMANTTSTALCVIRFPRPMRIKTSPALTVSNVADFKINYANASTDSTDIVNNNGGSFSTAIVLVTGTGTPFTVGDSVILRSDGVAGGFIGYDAEL